MNVKACTVTKKQPGEKMADHEDVLAHAQPPGRVGRREAITSAARSLASDETSFATGLLLVIDSGLSAQ
jgi:NAD(P)-dependent dehydrogenase (short-subunit alcohol dehydrogenase family)